MSKAAITVEAFVANELSIRTAGDHRVLDVSLPHTPSKRNEAGEWVDAGPTTWYQATFWDQHADVMLGTIEKGSYVTVTGYPEIEVYTKNDGQPGGKVKINFPTLAVIVRRPKNTTPNPPIEEPWAAAGYTEKPVSESGDVWNTPGSYNDETPF
jgi:single-stranded DNA-binding protein